MAELLELKKLTTGYPSHPLSSRLDMTFRPRELTAVIGPNGCGKTTLLRTIAALLPKVSGDILIEGKSISLFSRRELARVVSYLPQSRQIPDITAEILVSHGRFPHLGFSRKLTADDRQAVEEAISMAGISHLRGKRLPEMSGGERQQVYLAMTVAQQAKIVLLDEPGTYLDTAHRFEAISMAREMAAKGACVIMTIHELGEAMELADRICLMDMKGAVAWDGDAEGLYLSGLLDEVFGIEARSAEIEGKTVYVFLPKGGK